MLKKTDAEETAIKKVVATKLGKLLRQKRMSKMWTQDHLSEILKLTHVSISTYERGVAIPNGYTFLKLIRVLDISKEELASLMLLEKTVESVDVQELEKTAKRPEPSNLSVPPIAFTAPIAPVLKPTIDEKP